MVDQGCVLMKSTTAVISIEGGRILGRIPWILEKSWGRWRSKGTFERYSPLQPFQKNVASQESQTLGLGRGFSEGFPAGFNGFSKKMKNKIAIRRYIGKKLTTGAIPRGRGILGIPGIVRRTSKKKRKRKKKIRWSEWLRIFPCGHLIIITGALVRRLIYEHRKDKPERWNQVMTVSSAEETTTATKKKIHRTMATAIRNQQQQQQQQTLEKKKYETWWPEFASPAVFLCGHLMSWSICFCERFLITEFTGFSTMMSAIRPQIIAAFHDSLGWPVLPSFSCQFDDIPSHTIGLHDFHPKRLYWVSFRI